MPDLHLAVKGEYYREINAGRKTRENRKRTEYWKKRIENREYDYVYIRLGYPARDDLSRIMKFPWRGYELKTITHPHFGDKPVDVYAIILEDRIH